MQLGPPMGLFGQGNLSFAESDLGTAAVGFEDMFIVREEFEVGTVLDLNGH